MVFQISANMKITEVASTKRFMFIGESSSRGPTSRFSGGAPSAGTGCVRPAWAWTDGVEVPCGSTC